MLEVKELLGLLAQSMKGSEISHGEVAGSRVCRFSGVEKLEKGLEREFTVYGASMEFDFRGVLNLLVGNADGLIGLIPADLTRVGESRKVLTSLHRVLEAYRAEEKELPIAIQYHWALQQTGLSPEELDQNLGVNPQVVARVLSHAGDDNIRTGILALFEGLQRLKSSPK